MLIYSFKPSHKPKSALFISLIAIALTGIACSPFIKKNKDVSDFDALRELTGSVDYAYIESDDFKGVGSKKLIESNVVPVYLISKEGEIVNRHGGRILVSATSLENKYDALEIVYSGVPWHQCEQLILGTESLFKTIKIKGKLIKENNKSLIKETINNDCAARSDLKTGNVDITYVYKKSVIIIP